MRLGHWLLRLHHGRWLLLLRWGLIRRWARLEGLLQLLRLLLLRRRCVRIIRELFGWWRIAVKSRLLLL